MHSLCPELTLGAIGSVEALVALTLAQDALAVARAPLGAALRQLAADASHEGHLTGTRVVVVDGEEPVAAFQVVVDLSSYDLLLKLERSLANWSFDFPKCRQFRISHP